MQRRHPVMGTYPKNLYHPKDIVWLVGGTVWMTFLQFAILMVRFGNSHYARYAFFLTATPSPPPVLSVFILPVK